ncbi:DUF1566 domain-containing protein [Desulfonema magnum]|uniref:DUF1566 n=1 Tax=Desulfonema magnum TaxID=45655 RepID=A0A975BFH1_9BACT|nr:DUF1566 domain-containing protein [Desulfonema magnum]QTA84333.1 DUF1566 [Desulfonema magnum]
METKKTMAAFFVMLMLAIPGFALAGAVPDTGQTTCYDDQGNTITCPTECDDVNGCLRTFIRPDTGKTISSFYDSDGVQFSYYGFRSCYNDDGTEKTCPEFECRNKSGDVIPCPTGKCYDKASGGVEFAVCPPSAESTGTDDFYGQDGNYEVNPPSYTKLGDGGVATDTDWIMVKDESSGLIWLMKEAGSASSSQPNRAANTYTFSDATGEFISLVNTLGFGGYSDWRLPTVKELAFIVHSDKSGPAIDIESKSGYFLNMQAGDYWSATSCTGTEDGTDLSTQAFYVNFDDGSVGRAEQTESKYVIAVRNP